MVETDVCVAVRTVFEYKPETVQIIQDLYNEKYPYASAVEISYDSTCHRFNLRGDSGLVELAFPIFMDVLNQLTLCDLREPPACEAVLRAPETQISVPPVSWKTDNTPDGAELARDELTVEKKMCSNSGGHEKQSSIEDKEISSRFPITGFWQPNLTEIEFLSVLELQSKFSVPERLERQGTCVLSTDLSNRNIKIRAINDETISLVKKKLDREQIAGAHTEFSVIAHVLHVETINIFKLKFVSMSKQMDRNNTTLFENTYSVLPKDCTKIFSLRLMEFISDTQEFGNYKIKIRPIASPGPASSPRDWKDCVYPGNIAGVGYKDHVEIADEQDIIPLINPQDMITQYHTENQENLGTNMFMDAFGDSPDVLLQRSDRTPRPSDNMDDLEYKGLQFQRLLHPEHQTVDISREDLTSPKEGAINIGPRPCNNNFAPMGSGGTADIRRQISNWHRTMSEIRDVELISINNSTENSTNVHVHSNPVIVEGSSENAQDFLARVNGEQQSKASFKLYPQPDDSRFRYNGPEGNYINLDSSNCVRDKAMESTSGQFDVKTSLGKDQALPFKNEEREKYSDLNDRVLKQTMFQRMPPHSNKNIIVNQSQDLMKNNHGIMSEVFCKSFERARSWYGALRFEVCIGRLLYTELPKRFLRSTFDWNEWAHVGEDFVFKSIFSNLVTLDHQEAEFVCDLKVRGGKSFFSSVAHSSKVTYEFCCATYGQTLIFDAETFQASLYGQEHVFGCVFVANPQFSWDSSMSLTGYKLMKLDVSGTFECIAASLQVDNGRGTPSLSFQVSDDITVDSVKVKREKRYLVESCEKYGNLPFDLVVTEVQDLYIQKLPTQSRHRAIAFERATMQCKNRLWYTFSISPTDVNQKLESNLSIDVGSNADWSVEKILGIGEVHVLPSLLDIVELLCSKMNNVGFNNRESEKNLSTV